MTNATETMDLETAREEMDLAARYVAEALMRGLDTSKLLEEFKAARERYLEAE
jgi:hypothetical protein